MTMEQREEEYRKSMSSHSKVPLIGPVVKVDGMTWLTDRQFIFANEELCHVDRVFEKKNASQALWLCR